VIFAAIADWADSGEYPVTLMCAWSAEAVAPIQAMDAVSPPALVGRPPQVAGTRPPPDPARSAGRSCSPASPVRRAGHESDRIELRSGVAAASQAVSATAGCAPDAFRPPPIWRATGRRL